MRLHSEDKHHLRKSADRKAQIRKAFVPLTGLICAFRSAAFLRWCLSSKCNLMHNLFFYFQYFLVLIWSFFRWEEERYSQKFDRLFWCFDPLSRHLTEAKRKTRTVSKSATFLATEIVNSAPFKRGEKRCNILARKSTKLFANTKVEIFGKERCKIHRQFQRY